MSPLVQTKHGEMPEWSNGLVLKTSVPQGTEGSNPSLSAMIQEDGWEPSD